LEQQHELTVIELPAAFAEDAPHQQIDLFAQQFVLASKRLLFLSDSGSSGVIMRSR
jgi:hypothetical protein